MKKLNARMFACLLVMLTASLYADDPANTNSPASSASAVDNKAATIPDATHKPVLVTNTVTIAGQRVTYMAETGMLPVLKADGTTRASVFYIAYTRLGITNGSMRPVTFCFNGGPGSSSVWLHLGALGPRRAKMNDDGTQPPPPYALVDNQYSILDGSDLILLIPSRPDSAGRRRMKKRMLSLAMKRTWIPWVSSSGSGRRAMIAGFHQNICAAKVMGSFGLRAWRSICVHGTVCI